MADDNTAVVIVVLLLIAGVVGGVWYLVDKWTNPLGDKPMFSYDPITTTTINPDKPVVYVVNSFVFYHFEDMNITCVHRLMNGDKISCFKDI